MALPATLLSLSLTELRVDGNYFHPALWRENTNNQPQVNTCVQFRSVNNVAPKNKWNQQTKYVQNGIKLFLLGTSVCPETITIMHETSIVMIKTINYA